MSEQITKYKIFLASPSDLAEERLAAEEVISELNIVHGSKKGYILELLRWETHSVPGIAENHVQELINKDVAYNYDIFIGLLWTKFGTPTKNAGSGTEEEFDIAYARHQELPNQLKVIFYFKNAPKSPTEIDPEQLLKVQDFKRSLQEKNVLYDQFDTVDIFKKYLRMHIPHRIDDLRIPLIEVEEVSNLNSPEPIDELGLMDYRENYADYLNYTNQSLGNIISDTEWIGKEIAKCANDLTRYNKQPNPNEHVLRSLLHRAASSMEDYTNRLKAESPIFYSNYELAIDAGIGLLNVVSDFLTAETIEELEDLKESIFGLKRGIIAGITSMDGFHTTVAALPRIEQKINKARQKMSNELTDFIAKLNDVLKLTEEFSVQIGERIDQMKLKLN
ncbi:MAG: hypothetical protein ACI9G9_000795 [Psychromonas sp.]